jgi:hypothetical protein
MPLQLSALADNPVEVYCVCDPGLAARRYNDRARTCHPIHVLASVPVDVRAEYDRPVGIGKLVTVNTCSASKFSAWFLTWGFMIPGQAAW